MEPSTLSTPQKQLLDHADEFARRDPTKAVVTALGLGFLIHLLPLGAIVTMLFSIVLALARPALLFLGVMKTVDLLRSNSTTTLHE